MTPPPGNRLNRGYRAHPLALRARGCARHPRSGFPPGDQSTSTPTTTDEKWGQIRPSRWGQRKSSFSFSYAELAQLSDWYLTEEALRAAIADVVGYQHQLELASNWGDGTFSMSDAQRLEGGATDALRAAAAREFGYRRSGVALLSWVSDMYAIYGQKIVTLAGRESTYTLDEIAHNPILEIQRHTTDTYGSTDLLFALFDLIGKTFHPRIRDLQSHVDYRLGPGQPELQVDQLLLRKRVARPAIIIERWEEMQRAAASLTHGWVTSSMLISRLQA
ncbi:MAG: Tn3 family transposase, partial [Solirubrobacteraceae bacterium]